MGGAYDGNYTIRVPIDMIQFTDSEGKAWPIAFDWKEPNGDVTRVNIDRVNGSVPAAELVSGTVGDRYECVINGQIEYLYYSLLAPRTWIKLVEVSEAEYNNHYKLEQGA